MSHLILMRHGQSMWNAQDRFTGWIDTPLTARGVQEAQESAERIQVPSIDVIFTSELQRALQTAIVAITTYRPELTPVICHNDSDWYEHYGCAVEGLISIHRDSRLNERYYGDLQGRNKEQTRTEYGEDMVHLWRRSYDTSPPKGESLADTVERVMDCFSERILPELTQGKSVMICAHGNSLRALIKILEGIEGNAIAATELKTAECRIYKHDSGLFTRTF